MKEIQVTKDDVLGEIEEFFQSHGLNTNLLILNRTHHEIPKEAMDMFQECFTDEKIAVATIEPYRSDSFSRFEINKLKNQLGPIQNPLISCINLRLVVDFAGEIRSKYGPRVTLSDISEYLNTYGFSAAQIHLGVNDRFEIFETTTTYSRQSHDSNSIFSTIEETLKYSSENFLTEFIRQIDTDSRKILLDLSGLPRNMNGTSRVSLGLLKEINSQIISGKFEVDALVIAPQGILGELREKFTSLRFESDFLGSDFKFDLGFSITPVTSLKNCFEMSLRSAKWMVLQLDLIALRSYTHLCQQPSALEAFRFIQTYADVVIYISDFSANDAQNYLQEKPNAKQYVSLLGLPEEFQERTNISFDATQRNGNILVLGNDEPHKQVARVVKKLLEFGENVISISKLPPLGQKHSVIIPGALTETELTNLMQASSLIVFPSIYEGFGLPLIEAASIGRPVIAWNTEVNNEIINKFELANVYLCSSLEEIGDIVQLKKQTIPPQKISIPSLSIFNADIVNKINLLLNTKLEVDFAQKRWSAMRLIGSTFEESERLRITQFRHLNRGLLGRVFRKIGNIFLRLSETSR